MNADYSGRILFANDIAAENIQVRVFEQGSSNAPDQDLTISQGVSDTSGHFTVTFDSPSIQEFVGTVLSHPLGDLFSWKTMGNASQSNYPLPYLQFFYRFNDRPCMYSTPLSVVKREYWLPDVNPLDFTPSLQGFQFVNNFPGYPLPFSLPALPGLQKVPSNYGLCGGMSSAAYDFFLAGRKIPNRTDVPSQGSKFQRYLLQRSIDSFGPLGESVFKVAQWTALPDDTRQGTQKLTYDEFEANAGVDGIRTRLDKHFKVLIALVYQRAATPAELVHKIWENHQVLAIGYTMLPDNGIRVQIYDPNFPGRDDIYIQAKRVQVDTDAMSGEPLNGFQCMQWVGDQTMAEVRGFFAMSYSPVEPPPGL